MHTTLTPLRSRRIERHCSQGERVIDQARRRVLDRGEAPENRLPRRHHRCAHIDVHSKSSDSSCPFAGKTCTLAGSPTVRPAATLCPIYRAPQRSAGALLLAEPVSSTASDRG